MHLTFATLALASWLGIAGLTDPLWTLLGGDFAGPTKAGARWDPDGLAVTDPDGPDNPADAGAGWDPNG